MTDKKTLVGKVIPPGETDVVEANDDHNRLSRPRGFVASGLERIKLHGETKAAESEANLASALNDIGDQFVRQREISVRLTSLDEKLRHSDEIEGQVKAEVQADRLEQEQRKEDLANQKRLNNLRHHAEEVELQVRLAQAQRNLDTFNRKPTSGPTVAENLKKLETELREVIQERADAEKNSNGSLDEIVARMFDSKIGSLMRKIDGLRDQEGQSRSQTTSPYED